MATHLPPNYQTLVLIHLLPWKDKLRLAFAPVMIDTNVTMREFFGSGKLIRDLALANRLENSAKRTTK
jgi:hypothetical protein